MSYSPSFNSLMTKQVSDGGGTQGTATSTSSTTLTNSGATWTVNAFAGLTITAGTSVGVISSNTATVITVASWTGGTPSGTAAYTINNTGGGLTGGLVYTCLLPTSGFTQVVELELTNLIGGGIIYYTLDGSTPSPTNFSGVLPATVCSVTLPCDTTPTLKVITSAGSQFITAVVRGK